MRVLFATGSPAAYMAPPLLGDEQVNCGPDWADLRAPDGRWVSLRTPVGEYDIGTVIARMSAEQKPDLVVCLVDASWRNVPRGLATCKCPRVLLVADTHHMTQPLLGMLRYVTTEPFTRTVLLYDRHHETFFRSAGVSELYWLPGLTFPHTDAAVRSARSAGSHTSTICFVGQAGGIHPRRARLLAAMSHVGLPIDHRPLRQPEALRAYGVSLLGFNASLNGDLNLRVFEILASGAALLTDFLPSCAGLSALLCDGRQYLGYGSADELLGRARSALANSDATRAIGAAGARWFDEHCSEARRKENFRRMAFDGQANPMFALSTEASSRRLFVGQEDRFARAAAIYEVIQEMHRTTDEVRVSISPNSSADVAEMCGTLPRVKLVSAEDKADFGIVSRNECSAVAPATRRVWCWDVDQEDMESFQVEMGMAGFNCLQAKTALFARKLQALDCLGRKHVMVYTDDPDKGGVANYNHELALGMIAKGYFVTIVQTFSTAENIRRQSEAGVAHEWIGYDTGVDFVRTITDVEAADRAFKVCAPDLVIFSDCCAISNIAGKDAAIRANVPFITIVHNAAPYLATRFSKCLSVVGEQFKRAQNVIAVSSENLRLLRAHFGLSQDKGMVIFPGGNKIFFEEAPTGAREGLRRAFGIPPDAFVSLTSARLDPMKGFVLQIHAMNLLRMHFPRSKLLCVWAGEGEARASFAAEIAKNKLGERIKMIGRQSDIAGWLDAADLFTLTSLSEGMPISIMEAMAKKRPVISTAVGGVAEELADGGILLPDPNKDPKNVVVELAKAWAELENDPPRRIRLAEAARERALKHFQVSDVVGRIITEVESALSFAVAV